MRKKARALVSVREPVPVHVRGKTGHAQQGSSPVTVPGLEFLSAFADGRSWTVSSSPITPGKRDGFRARMGKDGEKAFCVPRGSTSHRPEARSAVGFPARTGQKGDLPLDPTVSLSLSPQWGRLSGLSPALLWPSSPKQLWSEAVYHSVKEAPLLRGPHQVSREVF